MISLSEFSTLEQVWLEQASIIAHGVVILCLFITFGRAKETSTKDREEKAWFTTVLLRSLRVVAYCVVYMALIPAVAWDLRDGMDLSTQFTLRSAIAACSTACFYIMQRHSVRSSKVENWVWIDEFCYHVLILDNLLFWDQQPEMLPTVMAMAIVGILQTVFPVGLVSALQHFAVLTVCLTSSVDTPLSPEGASRFFRVMMLFFYTLSVPSNRRVFDWNSYGRRNWKLSPNPPDQAPPKASSCLKFTQISSVIIIVAFAFGLGYYGLWEAPMTAIPCICVALCATVRVALLSD